jgi:hypothetical protein
LSKLSTTALNVYVSKIKTSKLTSPLNSILSESEESIEVWELSWIWTARGRPMFARSFFESSYNQILY